MLPGMIPMRLPRAPSTPLWRAALAPALGSALVGLSACHEPRTAPPPPPSAQELPGDSLITPARWFRLDARSRLGSRVPEGRLALIHGQRAVVSEEAFGLEEEAAPELLEQLVDVPLENGQLARIGCARHGVYRFDEWLGPVSKELT